MSLELLVSIFFILLGIYLLIGVMFAVAFLAKGAAAIDESAKGISWQSKLLLFPASVALWAILLPKWRKQTILK
jgi:hypothetical protein